MSSVPLRVIYTHTFLAAFPPPPQWSHLQRRNYYFPGRGTKDIVKLKIQLSSYHTLKFAHFFFYFLAPPRNLWHGRLCYDDGPKTTEIFCCGSLLVSGPAITQVSILCRSSAPPGHLINWVLCISYPYTHMICIAIGMWLESNIGVLTKYYIVLNIHISSLA